MKKILTLSCVLFFVVVVLGYSKSSVAAEPTYTEDELAKMAADTASVKPEEVKAEFALIQEATIFFNNMACDNVLPSTPKEKIQRLEAKRESSGYPVKYPVKVRIDVELKATASGLQEYTLEKTERDKAWYVFSAFQAGLDKKVELKLPSQADQDKANVKVPELVKEWNGQK